MEWNCQDLIWLMNENVFIFFSLNSEIGMNANLRGSGQVISGGDESVLISDPVDGESLTIGNKCVLSSGYSSGILDCDLLLLSTFNNSGAIIKLEAVSKRQISRCSSIKVWESFGTFSVKLYNEVTSPSLCEFTVTCICSFHRDSYWLPMTWE